jgi:tetratricopeptide (TPR) repeat protein
MIRPSAAGWTLVIFLAAWPVLGAGEIDRERLAKLSKLPRIVVHTRMGYTEEELAEIRKPLLHAELSEVQKALKAQPGDADRWNRLSELFGLLGEAEKEKAAATKAVDLFRQLLEKSPRDPRLLTGLGTALERAGSLAEAEEALRRATDLGPGEWRGWLALGVLLGQKVHPMILEGIPDREGETKEQKYERVRGRPDAAERIARAKRCMEEANAAYDRAVSAAPAGEADPLGRRGKFRTETLSHFRAIVRWLEDPKPGSSELSYDRTYLEEVPQASADLEEAARRRPDDFFAIAATVSMQLQAVVTEGTGGAAPSTSSIESRRQHLREAVPRLEKNAADAGPTIAARALELLAGIHFYLQDLGAAEECARAAVAADPARERARLLLLTLLKTQDRSRDAVAVLRDSLKVQDSSRTHFLIAKFLEEEDPAAAKLELEAALRAEPGDFYSNLGMAAIICRSPGDAPKAAPYIEKATAAYKSSPAEDEWIELTKARAIHLGLTTIDSGAIEQSRTALRTISDRHPEEDLVAEILTVLGGEAEVSLEEATRYYQAHPAEFASKGEVTFRMIGIDDGPDAAATLDRIDADLEKTSFEAAARKFYGEERGDGPYLWKRSLESLKNWRKPLAEEILKLKPGEVKRRIALGAGAGWRFVEMVAVKPGGTLSFEEARSQVEAAVQAERRKGGAKKQ